MRWKQHLDSSLKNSTLLCRSLAKSKRENTQQFCITELNEFDTEIEALDAEKFWIAYFECNRLRFPSSNGLNMTDGGQGISGYKHRIESKQKISESLLGHPVSLETRKKLSEAQTGKTRTFADSHKANLKMNVHNRKLNSEIVEQIKQDFEKGITRAELAQKYKLSYKSICRALT